MNRAERSRLAEHARFMRRNMTAAEKSSGTNFSVTILFVFPVKSLSVLTSSTFCLEKSG